jgi:hypothetical protein
MLLTASLVWDIRSFKRPVAERSGVPTLYPSTNAIFSPDNKHVVTGSGESEKGGHGALLFLGRQTLEVVKELDVGATPVVVQWHPKINQVRFLGLLPLRDLTNSTDYRGSHKWSIDRIVFATDVSQWGQIVAQ